MTPARELGLGKGKVYPADRAGLLLNPLRRLLTSPRRLERGIDLVPTARVLELGCGPGFFSPYLADRVPEGLLVLADLQVGMLERARGRARRGAPVQVDALALPFADGAFDAIVLVAVLGEVGDAGACLRELRRVLRVGGKLAVSETRTDPDYTRSEVLREFASDAGLRFLRAGGPPWEYTAHFTADPAA